VEDSGQSPAEAVDESSWDYKISSVTFNDGQSVELAPGSALFVVGPNNAGKSVALREIIRHLTPRNPETEPFKVVKDISVTLSGEVDDLEAWLEQNSFRFTRERQLVYQRPGASATWDLLREEWSNALAASRAQPPTRSWISNLFGFIVLYAAADARLSLLGEAGAYNPRNERPNHPLQALFAKPELETNLSRDSLEAFGSGVVLSRGWGDSLRLHMGALNLEPTVPPTEEYFEALDRLPLAAEQGDGVRSFLGLMLALNAAGYPIVVVDEPEAFLHPPQARLLGRKLATSGGGKAQVLIATHSSDVLRGALDATDSNVQVLRLTRDGSRNIPAVLSAGDLREIWSDPLLRYSNVLEGLFHRGVVVSEADADSRFYGAVLDVMGEAEGLAPHDLLLTQSGGKQRLSTILKALKSVGVPVAAVADFDVLREEWLLKRLVLDLGGDWDSLAPSWKRLHTEVGQLGSPSTVEQTKVRLNEMLDALTEPVLDKNSAKKLRSQIRIDNSWDLVKRGGLSALPQGEISRIGSTMLERLAAIGLFVVPFGELERWHPDIAGHGPEWVAGVLQERKHEDESNGSWEFVRGIREFFVR
jgi:hypothetical protein